jgi:predicted dehydrogenase
MVGKSVAVAVVICLVSIPVWAAEGAKPPEAKPFRIGMIGLDTSHVTEFTKLINDAQKNYGCKVVAGYPGGSPDVEASASRVQGFTTELKDKYGVEIVGTIDELCQKVDGVMLESVDGRPHLEQVRPVLAAKKPVFIDKPMAGSLAHVLEIFRLAKEAGVPCWSSSSLRYTPSIRGVKNREEVGDILGCDAFSPCSLEPHHPDLYWYGVHGVEILFTVMGTGCESVQRVQTDGYEYVVGVWKGGRIGTFRGLRAGKLDYGALVFGSKGIVRVGNNVGYEPLIEEVVKFFKTGQVPVPPDETIEIFAFMSAADESKAQNGARVTLASVLDKARKELPAPAPAPAAPAPAPK